MEKTKDQNKRIKRVALGLSGGVDSSVSAYLLKEKGYEVVGVYVQCWGAKADGCSADEDKADAVKVASKLGIKFVHLNFITEYKEKVIQYFYDEYAAGRTPNPDVMCNKEIKFGLFYDWAMEEGFDYVATGHYARVKEDADGGFSLLQGIDPKKDQSYFLYLLEQDQLKHVLFPLGESTKEEVREIAKNINLHNAEKKDSVGICFIGEVDIKEFLKKKLPIKPGKVVNKEGNVIGDHDGVHFYTIGQRHGFKVTKYTGLPMYVIDKNTEKNELVVGFSKEAYVNKFVVESFKWMGDTLTLPLECEVRIRHLGELYKCKVSVIDRSQIRAIEKNESTHNTVFQELESETLIVELQESIFGVAPGQSAVLYNDDELLGGGVIGQTFFVD